MKKTLSAIAVILFLLSSQGESKASIPGNFYGFAPGTRGGMNILTSDRADYLDPGPQIGIHGRKFFHERILYRRNAGLQYFR